MIKDFILWLSAYSGLTLVFVASIVFLDVLVNKFNNRG